MFELPVDVVRRILCFAAKSRARERAMTEGNDLPYYFSGEDELSALLLAMVIDHCGSCSPEKRRTMTSFSRPIRHLANGSTATAARPMPTRCLRSTNRA